MRVSVCVLEWFRKNNRTFFSPIHTQKTSLEAVRRNINFFTYFIISYNQHRKRQNCSIRIRFSFISKSCKVFHRNYCVNLTRRVSFRNLYAKTGPNLWKVCRKMNKAYACCESVCGGFEFEHFVFLDRQAFFWCIWSFEATIVRMNVSIDSLWFGLFYFIPIQNKSIKTRRINSKDFNALALRTISREIIFLILVYWICSE